MTKINIKLITNSAISYLSAFLVATILHECGHALTAKLLNINCILYHNYVKFSTLNVPVPKIVIILASGPLTSLISGIIFKFFFNKRKIRDQFQLFLLWSYLIGLTNFFGYVMIGAFTNSGDIGQLYEIYNIPLWIRVIFSIYAAIYLNSLAGNSTVHYMSFYNINTFLESDNSRKSFAFQFIIIPWLIGSFIATLLYLPVPMILSLIYPILSGMIFITPYKLSIYIKNIPTSSEINFEKFSLTSVFICIFVVGVFRFVLVPGIIL